jgi:hypothetical protein
MAQNSKKRRFQRIRHVLVPEHFRASLRLKNPPFLAAGKNFPLA